MRHLDVDLTPFGIYLSKDDYEKKVIEKLPKILEKYEINFSPFLDEKIRRRFFI